MAVNLVGRDKVSKVYLGYECKPDHAYRAIDRNELEQCLKNGCVMHPDKIDYIPYQNNGGIDWFKGGVGNRYVYEDGFIIETECSEEYFQNAVSQLARDPQFEHVKSSSKNPVPISKCKIMQVEKMKSEDYSNIIPEKYKDKLDKNMNKAMQVADEDELEL